MPNTSRSCHDCRTNSAEFTSADGRHRCLDCAIRIACDAAVTLAFIERTRERMAKLIQERREAVRLKLEPIDPRRSRTLSHWYASADGEAAAKRRVATGGAR